MSTTGAMAFDVVVYHNPDCGTSRNVLALIRSVGIEPHVVEYLKSLPSRALLQRLATRAGLPLRALLRANGTPYADLRLDNPALTDDDLLDAIDTHPILLQRPLVVTPMGVALCRPSERVLQLLPAVPAAAGH
jgi:arsenate reductase